MYDNYGHRELIVLAYALEKALIEAYEELGMTRSDAQGAAHAVVQRAS